MAQVKVGDRVRVADREPTNADVKSGLFYGYFSSLVGKVERVYDDNTICLDVETDTLPESVRIRHLEMQTAARDKWISGLPQEQRNRLSEQDKQFKMSYKVLVAAADVDAFKGTATKTAPKSSSPKANAGEPKPATNKVADAPTAEVDKPAKDIPKPAAKTAETEASASRLTEKDLEAREQEYLKSLRSKQSGDERKAGES